MSYTFPVGQPQGCPTSFLNRLREVLIAEIYAINGYETHIANSNMSEVNEVWRHIMRDEKDHYGMFLELLHRYDPVQCQMYLRHKNDATAGGPLQVYRPEYDRQLILNNVREDIKGELEAVILYEQNVRDMPYADIKNVFATVISAEKEHAEHLTRVLLRYDSDKYDSLT
jgi:rubrerythrin